MKNLGRFIKLGSEAEWIESTSYQILNQLLSSSYQKFYLAISGGTTPIRVFENITKVAFSNSKFNSIVWSNVFFYWVDERVVSITNNQSNYGNIIHILKKLGANYYPMFNENEGLDNSIHIYNQNLSAIPQHKGNPKFNLIILGMGNDGHTASLFPKTEGLKEYKKWVISNYVPQHNQYRITLTYPVINNADSIIVLLNGDEKIKILQTILSNKQPNYPIEFIENDNINWIYYI